MEEALVKRVLPHSVEAEQSVMEPLRCPLSSTRT